MGCVSSNEQHPNLFQVSNVNDHGDLVSPGQLQVTETELVWYQKGKNPTVWPLRSLRKYGFDSEIFSFECGRRCPTGQGIYAFRCRKAEQLFNIVQHYIVRNSDEMSTPPEFPVPLASTGPPVHRRMPSQPEGYLNPVNNARPPGLSRPGSLTSNGPLSPVSPPPVEEHNNNKRASLPDEVTTPNYANLGAGEFESPCHLYMNVDTKAANPKDDEEEPRHCYANVNAKDLEHLRPLLKDTPSVPQTPTALYITVHEVNYAELDLEQSKLDQSSQVTPESPKGKKSYATIDFQRTNALSQSINPPLEVEEGSRKTRHNSTISDVTTTRHSNSLSD